MPAIRALIALSMILGLTVSSFAAEAPKPRADYAATRKGPTITVTASGNNPTGGWKNILNAVGTKAGGTEFAFSQVPPDGPATQVITPFSTSASVDSDAKSVIIVDAAGRHEVAVK